MSHINPKSYLKELFDSVKIAEAPKYESTVEGPPHAPTFRSVVSHPSWGSRVFRGETASKQVEAEKSAARLAVEFMVANGVTGRGAGDRSSYASPVSSSSSSSAYASSSAPALAVPSPLRTDPLAHLLLHPQPQPQPQPQNDLGLHSLPLHPNPQILRSLLLDPEMQPSGGGGGGGGLPPPPPPSLLLSPSLLLPHAPPAPSSGPRSSPPAVPSVSTSASAYPNPRAHMATRVVLVDLSNSHGARRFVRRPGDYALGFFTAQGAHSAATGSDIAFPTRELPGGADGTVDAAIAWKLASLVLRDGLAPRTPVYVVSTGKAAHALAGVVDAMVPLIDRPTVRAGSWEALHAELES
jgi:hypothetical protein